MTTLIKSNVLDAKTKKKVVRSYIRGEDLQCIANLRGITLEEVQGVVNELWETARNTGGQIEVNPKKHMALGEIELLGKMSNYMKPGSIRAKFKITPPALKRILKIYQDKFGEEGYAVAEKSRDVVVQDEVEKINVNHMTSCPCCNNNHLNILYSSYDEVSVVELVSILKRYGISLTSVKKNYYCRECFSEFFLIRHEKIELINGKKVKVIEENPYNGIIKFNHWAMKEI